MGPSYEVRTHKAELNSWMHVGEIKGRRSSGAWRGCLEDGRDYTMSRREVAHFGIVQIQHQHQDDVHKIENDKYSKQHPGWTAWKEEGVAAPRVVE